MAQKIEAMLSIWDEEPMFCGANHKGRVDPRQKLAMCVEGGDSALRHPSWPPRCNTHYPNGNKNPSLFGSEGVDAISALCAAENKSPLPAREHAEKKHECESRRYDPSHPLSETGSWFDDGAAQKQDWGLVCVRQYSSAIAQRERCSEVSAVEGANQTRPATKLSVSAQGDDDQFLRTVRLGAQRRSAPFLSRNI